jgi:hypothetical protein
MPSILSTGFARLTCQSFEYLGYSEPYISYWPIVVPAARRPRRPQLEKVPTPIASPAEPVGSATVAPARRPLPRKTAVSTDTVWRRSLTRFGHGLCTEPEPYNLIPASRITAPNSLSDVVFPVSGRAGNREPILHHNDVCIRSLALWTCLSCRISSVANNGSVHDAQGSVIANSGPANCEVGRTSLNSRIVTKANVTA